MNGKLYIGEIEGTIFTSLTLRNTVVTMEDDTLLNAGTISVKTSPLQLLLKKIKVRDVEIKNTDISLLVDSSGTMNISKLFPSSNTVDTSKSTFPFTIEVAKLYLKNVNLSLQKNSLKNSKEIYESLNMNDLRLKNLNLP